MGFRSTIRRPVTQIIACGVKPVKISDPQYQDVLDNARCLATAVELEQAIEVMAAKMNRQLVDKNPLLLCVMSGGMVTCGQLLPFLNFELELEYVHPSYSAKNGKTRADSGNRWPALPQINLSGRMVVLVDDIHDEGVSLHSLRSYCLQQGASDVQIAVLIEKQHQRKKLSVAVDYYALAVDDCFVFGSGLDYKGGLRNAPGIFAAAQSGKS